MCQFYFVVTFYILVGCIGFLIPPFGNYFAAEKIDGVGDCAKYVGCLDFLGGVLVCSMLGQCLIRQKIRERENIDGSAIGDMFASLCCLECSICQTVHHVDSD